MKKGGKGLTSPVRLCVLSCLATFLPMMLVQPNISWHVYQSNCANCAKQLKQARSADVYDPLLLIIISLNPFCSCIKLARPDGTSEVRALRDLNPGVECTISYLAPPLQSFAR